MAPGMVNSASVICDKVGHIMCYGDGWYGGVYVAALYASAFVYDDIRTVVTEALKVIPVESNYYRCMHDVIAWCGEMRTGRRPGGLSRRSGLTKSVVRRAFAICSISTPNSTLPMW